MERFPGVENDEMEKFVVSLGDLKPAFPDELVRVYLARTGFQSDDLRLDRYVALAAQKFLADIANDTIGHSRMRQNAAASKSKTAAGKDSKLTLTVDDLERALRDYGVMLRKPPYFADSVNAGVPENPPPGVGKPTSAGLSPSKQVKP